MLPEAALRARLQSRPIAGEYGARRKGGDGVYLTSAGAAPFSQHRPLSRIVRPYGPNRTGTSASQFHATKPQPTPPLSQIANAAGVIARPVVVEPIDADG